MYSKYCNGEDLPVVLFVTILLSDSISHKMLDEFVLWVVGVSIGGLSFLKELLNHHYSKYGMCSFIMVL